MRRRRRRRKRRKRKRKTRRRRKRRRKTKEEEEEKKDKEEKEKDEEEDEKEKEEKKEEEEEKEEKEEEEEMEKKEEEEEEEEARGVKLTFLEDPVDGKAQQRVLEEKGRVRGGGQHTGGGHGGHTHKGPVTPPHPPLTVWAQISTTKELTSCWVLGSSLRKATTLSRVCLSSLKRMAEGGEEREKP